MRFRAVLFDMDGVLSDTERLHGIAQETMLKAWNIDLPAAECSRRFAGIPEKDIWPVVFAEAGLPCPSLDELMQKKIETMLELLRGSVPPTPGMHALLSRVRALGLLTAVASSAAPILIERTLSGLGIDGSIDSVTSGHEVPHGKPAPDIFLRAAEKLSLAPSACLVIEDAHAGVAAAKAAGMACVGYLPAGSPQDLSAADRVVQNLDEITEDLLKSLSRRSDGASHLP